MQKDDHRFYKILTTENAEEATIMLYGYIGESYEYDEERDRWAPGGITDIAFVKELNRLASKYKVIHLRINSYGGDMLHGLAIITAIRACSAEVHGWNDGLAGSMAADIFLCCPHRHMAQNAVLMIHQPRSFCYGTAQDMRDCAEATDKFAEAAIIATATSTGISEDEIRSRYYADYKDHWLSYNDAVADGLLTDTEDTYEAAALPDGVEKMTYKELAEWFEKHGSAPEEKTLLERLRSIVEKRLLGLARKTAEKQHTTPTLANKQDMNLTEFKASLTDGTLDMAEVKKHLAALDAAAAPEPAPEPAVPDPELVALKKEVADLKNELAEFKSAPGAAKSTPGHPGPDAPGGETQPDVLEQFNKEMADIAPSGALPFRPNL